MNAEELLSILDGKLTRIARVRNVEYSLRYDPQGIDDKMIPTVTMYSQSIGAQVRYRTETKLLEASRWTKARHVWDINAEFDRSAVNPLLANLETDKFWEPILDDHKLKVAEYLAEEIRAVAVSAPNYSIDKVVPQPRKQLTFTLTVTVSTNVAPVLEIIDPEVLAAAVAPVLNGITETWTDQASLLTRAGFTQEEVGIYLYQRFLANIVGKQVDTAKLYWEGHMRGDRI